MFEGRICRPPTAIGFAILASVAFALGAVTTTSAAVSRLPFPVLLTVSPSLPDISRRALVDEAARIWRREQVEIRWTTPVGGTERPDASLRVLVIAHPASSPTDAQRWPVAELLLPAGDRALAIASISGARRVVTEADRFGLLELTAVPEYRLGLVLGRAVAHEIGHFLLATGTHAERGLMRASVEAHEFAAVGADSFRLDADASRWLRARMRSASAIAALRSATFSY